MPPRILLCPPDFYGIEYEINPWMKKEHASTPEVAQRQWRTLHDTLKGLGVQIELLKPQTGLVRGARFHRRNAPRGDVL
jgi:N-dimethylarginine dimethylaminohydrolase